MGADRHHRQCDRADRVPLAAHGLDVCATTNAPRRRAPAFSPACRRGGSANQTISRGRFCSSRRRPRTSIPAISSTPTAAIRRDDDDPQRIAILGGGLMGHGIAQVFACAGHRVTITDPSVETRDRIADRIGGNLDDLGADRAALANVERRRLARSAAWRTPIGSSKPRQNSSNSSSRYSRRSIAPRRPTQFSPRIRRSSPSAKSCPAWSARHRALGTHWWNPPYLVPLVEVVRTAETSDAAVAATMELLKSIGKAPVEVKKDVPDSWATGFSTRFGARRSL